MTEIQILLTNWMNALAVLLPFGYSFGAGMVSTVNPCGFSMLPAYLSLFLGDLHEGSGACFSIEQGACHKVAILFCYMVLTVLIGYLFLEMLFLEDHHGSDEKGQGYKASKLGAKKKVSPERKNYAHPIPR